MVWRAPSFLATRFSCRSACFRGVLDLGVFGMYSLEIAWNLGKVLRQVLQMIFPKAQGFNVNPPQWGHAFLLPIQ